MSRRLLVLAVLVALTSPARGEPSEPAQAAWTTDGPAAGDLAAGRPLVVRVIIPLCSNDQVSCGASWAGQPGRPKTNLYWGAIFGARTLFEARSSPWHTVEIGPGEGPVVERAVYRRSVPGELWGLEGEIEQIAVLEAHHGDHIDAAVRALMETAARGGTTTFRDGDRVRTERIHVVGYAGHNRLMDGVSAPEVEGTDSAIPSFVLACDSERWFSQRLVAVGSRPLVMTRALMAPEGYVVDAAVRAVGERAPERAVRDRVVRAYARWQRTTVGAASVLFAR